MTKIYLITGFLGAGKTTFLNERLHHTNRKVGVLMNEFGNISMDTVAVDTDDMAFVELKNGSIFCACLKDHFIEGLSQLVQMDLEEIYIESSGLADPSDMGKVMEVLFKTVANASFAFAGTICLVDGVYFFEELSKLVSVERQIRHAHLLLINKADLIDGEKVSKIRSTINELNPEASIIMTIHGKLPNDELPIHLFEILDEETTNSVSSKPKNAVITFKESVEKQILEKFLNQIVEDFYRIKGFVALDGLMHKVDTVNTQVVIEPFGGGIQDDAVNSLVCLASGGIASISKLAVTAGECFGDGFDLRT